MHLPGKLVSWQRGTRQIPRPPPGFRERGQPNFPRSRQGFLFRLSSRWWKKHKGGPADLNILYRRIVKAIREVDPDTPIILEGYTYGTPEGLAFLEPLDDPAILYSFHFYAPYVFNDPVFNKGRYSWPDAMPGARDGETAAWTIENLRVLMKPAADWSARRKIPAHRIFVGEFCCQRPVKGIQQPQVSAGSTFAGS